MFNRIRWRQTGGWRVTRISITRRVGSIGIIVVGGKCKI